MTVAQQALPMDAPHWPDPDAVLALVRRLPTDPAAQAEFLAAVYRPLLREVQAAHPLEDPARVTDVVGDLLLSLVKRPEQYHPDKLPVRSYLLMAARGDLANARAKDGRRRAREIPLDAVAEPVDDGKEKEEDDVRTWLINPRVAAVIAGFDALEREVWELMQAGTRATTAFVPVLGIADRPSADQGRAVKRIKDRIIKRLKRAAEDGR